MSVKEKLDNSIFSKIDDNSADNINKKDYNNAFTIFRNLLGDIRKETDYKKTQSELEAYKLLNKFFWKLFGVNFVYSKTLNADIDGYNQARGIDQGDKLVKEYLFTKEDSSPEEQVGDLVKPVQIINPVSDEDERRTIYYFVNNIGKFIDEIFDKNKEIILYFLNRTTSSPQPNQTREGGPTTPPWVGSIEIPDLVSEHAIILKAILEKIFNAELEIKTEADLEKIKNDFKKQVETNKEQLTIEQIIFLMRVYFLSYLPLSKKIEDAAKAEETEDAAKAKETEDAAKEDEDSDTATGGTRSGGTSPSGPTFASTYNIRKAPKDRWIGGYQVKLKSFYDKNAATKEIASKYEARKLTDGRYGYRTHYVTIKAAENIISQLDKFLNPKAPAPAAAPAVNERRIRQLSKLLEIKLVGAELNLFNEQDESAPDAEKKRKLQDLLKELNEIKRRLADAHNENSIPKEDRSVEGKDLARFNEILSMLSWNEKGEIDFNEVYKKMQPSQPPTSTTQGQPKGEVVKRPSETSCFYAIDRTISGVTDMSPTKIWASVGESWDKWYKEALELLEDEAASRQFYYLSGPQSSYLGVVKSMDNNAALNINLFCVSLYMTKLKLNLEGNMKAAQNLAQSRQEPVKNYSNFVDSDGKFEKSRAAYLVSVIDKVITNIPNLRKYQNQNAEVTNDKRLAVTGAQSATIEKAATVAARGTPPAAPAAPAVPTSVEEIAKIFLKRAKERVEFKETILRLGTPNTANTAEVMDLAKVLFRTTSPSSEQLAMVNAAITQARNAIIKTTGGEAAKPQQESLKQRRDKLLHEAIFKKLVK